MARATLGVWYPQNLNAETTWNDFNLFLVCSLAVLSSCNFRHPTSWASDHFLHAWYCFKIMYLWCESMSLNCLLRRNVERSLALQLQPCVIEPKVLRVDPVQCSQPWLLWTQRSQNLGFLYMCQFILFSCYSFSFDIYIPSCKKTWGTGSTKSLRWPQTVLPCAGDHRRFSTLARVSVDKTLGFLEDFIQDERHQPPIGRA